MSNPALIAVLITVSALALPLSAGAVDWSKPVQWYKDGKRYDLLCYPPLGPKTIDDQGYRVYENMTCDILKETPCVHKECAGD